MPRPRLYDPDAVLDAAEALAVHSGPAAVTIRAISDTVGLSNGALYHSFGSRAGLLGQVWLRAGRRFLALQRELVESAQQGADAIAAAAYAPVIFAERHAASARLLLQVRREQVLGHDLPAELAEQARELEKQLVDLMIELAAAAWDRRDRAAVDTVTTCIVDLPTPVLPPRNRLDDPTARDHLNAAVAAVLAGGPGPRHTPKLPRRKESHDDNP
ncbi:TetR/AcrR family transcriptional regulator [Mycolicibacterium boenickei]|uniref:TetR/AcrR family transcriptional regulator n=1 Tax=Mycolicibacterium boenickei TaxID=146017 RepID=UPI00098A9F22|nr:TetR/AcrR family transcriptional regulator [Mycolicibacterium boenickei]